MNEWYYRVKVDTEFDQALQRYFDCPAVWEQNKDVIEGFLGQPMDQYLYMDANELSVNPDKLPEAWKPHFKKGNPAQAKKRSSLRVAWLKLVNEHGLYHMNAFHIRMLLCDGWKGAISCYRRMEGHHYLKIINHEINLDKGDHKHLEKVKASEFMALYAKYLAAIENEMVLS